MQHNVIQHILEVFYFCPVHYHTVLKHAHGTKRNCAWRHLATALPHSVAARSPHNTQLCMAALGNCIAPLCCSTLTAQNATVHGGTWQLHCPTGHQIRHNPILRFSSYRAVKTFPVRCNQTASGALGDNTALRLYRGVLYLQNVVRFHGTLASVTSCTLKGEV